MKGQTVTPVEPPLRTEDTRPLNWADEADVVVVGWGAAGASAALQARSEGADVLVIDRFDGGGATALSGGVVYAGGGTTWQDRAGVQDSPEAMAHDLAREVGTAVRPETLSDFCRVSHDNLQWLASHGVPFSHEMPEGKTSYPPPGRFLYHSGNETVSSLGGRPDAPPRGHRVVSQGQSGAVLFARLAEATEREGCRVLRQGSVRRLVFDESQGRVVGVEVWRMPPGDPRTRRHAELHAQVARWRLIRPGKAQALRRACAELEQAAATPVLVRARSAVVLSTGGFIYNREMLQQHAPKAKGGWPIGAAGCDGSAVRLATPLGAACGAMDNVSLWRFITPPQTWMKGLVVNREGRRFCNEEVYGATLGHWMAQQTEGRAWLVMDAALRWQAIRECLTAPMWGFQRWPALAAMLMGCVRGADAADLARRLALDPTGLGETLRRADQAAQGEAPDETGKSAARTRRWGRGPLYALDISSRSRWLPMACLTLGGLRVDERTGAVVDADGLPIAGLYAAGRAAVGVASGLYVSGLSLADCVYSGRRAGLHAAASKHGTKETTA